MVPVLGREWMGTPLCTARYRQSQLNGEMDTVPEGQQRSTALHTNTYSLFFNKTTHNYPSPESQKEMEKCA